MLRTREKVGTFSSLYVFFTKNYNMFTTHIHSLHTYSLHAYNDMILPRHNTSFIRYQTYTACFRLFNDLTIHFKQLQDVNNPREELNKFQLHDYVA